MYKEGIEELGNRGMCTYRKKNMIDKDERKKKRMIEELNVQRYKNLECEKNEILGVIKAIG